jgi:Ca2+-transporting ATPase
MLSSSQGHQSTSMSAVKEEQSISGLSTAEAGQRLAASGYNELNPPRPRRLWHIVANVLREPMFLLLIAAGGIYLLLGDIQDALMLLFFVVLIIVMTVSQQHKSQRVLEALRDLSSPRALVIRDGRQQRIAGREVVPGDLMLLNEGDRVAADAVLLSCNDLSADESMLTGESVPVRKLPGSAPIPNAGSTALQPGGDDQPFVYAGTVLVQGSGIARVTATGKSSAIGQIGKSLADTRSGTSPLRIQTDRLVGRLAIYAGAFCVLLVLIYGISRGHWLDALLAGISLAMAALPEEFPVILSVFMALGAWRISRRNVLTRQLNAIETLGATTVLCTDKTGTLTENRMVIDRLYSNGQMLHVERHNPLPEPWHELVEFGILASERDPFDPMERALHELGQRTLSGSEHLHAAWELVHEYSLSPGLLAMSGKATMPNTTWLRPRARPRRSSTCATCPRRQPQPSQKLQPTWPTRACVYWGWRVPNSSPGRIRNISGRRNSTTSSSPSSAWSACRIPCVPKSRRPSHNAVRQAFGWW